MYKIIFKYNNDDRAYQVGSIKYDSFNNIEEMMIVPTDGFFSTICFTTDDINEAERIKTRLQSTSLESRNSNHIIVDSIKIINAD